MDKNNEANKSGWQCIGEIFNQKEDFFEKTLFLQGYDFSSNIYVVVGDYLSLIDAGNDYTAFIELFNLGFKPTDIKKIVLTHTHLDHSIGIIELLRAYPSIIQTGGFELILHKTAPTNLKKIVKEYGCKVTEVIGGEVIKLGDFECEVVYTPGHTQDGICIYHAQTKTVFTGDTVLPDVISGIDKNAGGDLFSYLYGIRSLLKRDIENLLPGHDLPKASQGKEIIEKTYEALIREITNSDSKTPWIKLAFQLAERGFLEEAVFCCNKELITNPKDLKSLQLKALCLTDLGQYNEAVKLFDKILQKQSNNLYALIGKGKALLGQKKYNKSLEYFNQVLKINPHIKEAQIYKGIALYLSGRQEEAMKIEVFKRSFNNIIIEKGGA